MSNFKPMVKMMTDEPSVSLKLKKGGKVKSKKQKAESTDSGHKPMHKAMGGNMMGMPAEMGIAPKKPSMMARMKAMKPMNPQLYAKGGKVAHKVMGGAMAMPNQTMPTPMTPMKSMAPNVLAGMNPKMRNARAMQVRKALTGMKKGGNMDAKCCADLEKELRHHEKLSMKDAHPMRKASGGAIDRDDTMTTVKGNVKKYAKTLMHDGDHFDKTSGKTGEVKLGAAGYKRGGKAYASGGTTGDSIPSDSNKKKNSGKTVMGGTIEDNEGDYEDTQMHTADKFSGSKTTGGVRMSNAGGFKAGGKAKKYASGGAIDKYQTRDTVEGGNWENRPANGTPKGKTNTKTGEVKLANAGGYKTGGKASKKHFATGGSNVNDMGKAVKMPKHFVSLPVANSLQSGTFKKGGDVKKLAKGGRAEKEEKPNLRLISTHTGPKGHVAKVYKDKDWGEHRVRFYSPEGKHYTEGDYHTDDKEDAHDTAKFALNRFKQGGTLC